ncbi:MAG: DUF4396 domain-containing protein [Acidobacteriaceae bacterium]
MLNILAWTSLAIAFASALIISADEIKHPQKMWIMNVVWPVTALYSSVFAVWGYFRLGRTMARDAMQSMSKDEMQRQMKQREEQARRNPTWQQTALSDSHCGAGCTLGDIIAEFSIAGLGLTLLGTPLYAEMAGDLLLAWLLGIAFQYFTIKPMRNLSPVQGLIAAVKADTLSILTFEMGLFGWMALTYFVLFPGPHLKPDNPVYWLMMQIGMVIGYFTSYPMNRLLVKWGTKEAMG